MKKGYTMFYIALQNQTDPASAAVVRLEEPQFDTFAEHCEKDATDVVAVSRTALRRIGEERLRRIMLVPAKKIVAWLKQDGAPQPIVDELVGGLTASE